MSATATSAAVSAGRALALLAVVIVLWGVNWPVMKVGLAHIGPFQFALARMLMGGIILWLVAWASGNLQLPHRRDWPLVLTVGVGQMGLFMALTNTALQFVPAGRSAILAYTTPIWAVPMAVLWLREPVGRIKWLGFALGVAGVAVLFNPLAFDWHDRDVVIGNGLLVAVAMLWAGVIVHIRGHRWHGSPLSLMPWQFLIGVAILAPLTLWLEGGRAIDWSPALAAVLVYNGPIATAFCFWAMITIGRALPATTTSVGSLGVPVVGMVTSALALGEPVTASKLAGLALILGGVLAVTLGERVAAGRALSA